MIAGLRPAATAALALTLAWGIGGQALLGRIDPALALPTLPLPLLLLAAWQRGEARKARLGAAGMVLLLLLVAQATLALWLSGRTGWGQLVLIAAAGAVAALIADVIVQGCRGAMLRWAAAAVYLLVWFAAGHLALSALYTERAGARPPSVVMLTGLPLRWAGQGGMAAMVTRGAAEDPALARIEASGPVDLVDSLTDRAVPAGATLLVAHPRALPAPDLVAIDAFVRGGGRAVILADALSGWPVRYPLGDPRNPPVTSLLTPMLDHWGVTLGPAPVGERTAQAVDVDGARLRLFSAGRFEVLPAGCSALADRRIAHCTIGAGEAWLVGDADLLFAPLWRPLVPGAEHLRRADTMVWLGARLRGEPGDSAVLQPLWISST